MITYLEAIRQALSEEMQRDERVVLMGEDIGAFGGAFKVTEGLFERFGPDRVLDTPISESGFVGAAIGASMLGFRPVVELQFIDFLANCYNMVVNFAAWCRYRWNQGVPLVLRGPCGAGVSGGPFHSQSPEARLMPVPGLKIVFPATAEDARGLLKAAIRDPDPVIYLEHKFLYRRIKGEMPPGEGLVPIGKACVRRHGGDLAIITYGATVHTALEAAQELAREGVQTRVLDLRTLAPLDEEAILETAALTSKVLLLHETNRTSGPAAEVAALIAEKAFEYLDGPLVRVTAPDTPVPYSPPLEKAWLPGTDKVLAAARQLLRY
ncbi:MAG TPA: alpha-ketoacid dehydrogenase subunit beta [Candidatus Nitrosotenuis sp.]|jgi:2-oxoisovalerate dehydrogenase E1 component beta subunit|nr:alpha-ketoacid dehydrogenase subunit beta [Candidatus Nitrosotenuis sp.]